MSDRVIIYKGSYVVEVYLAARYSRRLELCEYRSQLEDRGFSIPAKWLQGSHQITTDGRALGDAGESLVEATGESDAELRRKFAQDDYDDVASADMLVAFTEAENTPGRSRGGRHVELGIALALGKTVVVVGPHENIFTWLPQVNHFDTWEQFLEALDDYPNPCCLAPAHHQV